MVKKKESSQETVMEESKGEDSPQTVPQADREPDDVFADWPELQRLLNKSEIASVDDLFAKGWRPNLKRKPNGSQYITLRFHGHNEDGETIDTERGLGFLDPQNPERWTALTSIFPQKPLPENATTNSSPYPNHQPSGTTGKSSVLTTRIGKVAPISPTVQIKLGTLQWFTWVQQAAGYPGSLDDFINETVDSYFREHHHLELAVVYKGEDRNS